jgi:hypothetical protein
MTRKLVALMVVAGAVSVVAAGRRGTVPRISVQEYSAHAQRSGIGVGAVLPTTKQTRKKFAADVNRCCVVVETAFYPAKEKGLDVALDDIMIETEADGLVRPISARAVAAKLQEMAEHGRNVAMTTCAGVGYESGTYTDPVTGEQQRIHGVSTAVGVDVGTKPEPKPGTSNRSRDNAETELREQSLPEGIGGNACGGLSIFSFVGEKEQSEGALTVAVRDERADRGFEFEIKEVVKSRTKEKPPELFPS